MKGLAVVSLLVVAATTLPAVNQARDLPDVAYMSNGFQEGCDFHQRGDDSAYAQNSFQEGYGVVSGQFGMHTTGPDNGFHQKKRDDGAYAQNGFQEGYGVESQQFGMHTTEPSNGFHQGKKRGDGVYAQNGFQLGYGEKSQQFGMHTTGPDNVRIPPGLEARCSLQRQKRATGGYNGDGRPAEGLVSDSTLSSEDLYPFRELTIECINVTGKRAATSPEN
ncbi:hypothetical protein BBP40_011592 [Aspergillus hancockii]|nr:hypothetical protein BBP40_011592 [Aspergillus hancockii]